MLAGSSSIYSFPELRRHDLALKKNEVKCLTKQTDYTNVTEIHVFC